MMRGNLALALRACALVGVIAGNWAIPARAQSEPAACYGCVFSVCMELAYGSGHTFCQTHDDHCDQYDPCVKPM